jgi:hypothetical protein
MDTPTNTPASGLGLGSDGQGNTHTLLGIVEHGSRANLALLRLGMVY